MLTGQWSWLVWARDGALQRLAARAAKPSGMQPAGSELATAAAAKDSRRDGSGAAGTGRQQEESRGEGTRD